MPGYIRHPRVIIETGEGTFIPLECEVNVSQHQSADTFSAKIPLDGPNGLDEKYWADAAPIEVTVKATNDALSSGFVEMYSGVVDKPSIDMNDRTVHISGRDKTSKMLDSKTNEKWQNKQPQDIITDLAARSGLSVNFNGTALDKAGLKFNQDYNRISELDSHWNVVVRLAKQLGCIAFIKGNILNVQPWDAGAGSAFKIHYVRPTKESFANGSFISLKMTRDLNLSKKVKVNHRSWQHKQGEAVESEFEYDGVGGELSHGLKGANMTKQQQDAIAESRLNEILSHERSLELGVPGDVNIDPTGFLTLTGTGTGFDQDYVISSIKHDWSFDAGYRMQIRARNKDKKRGKAKKKK